MNGCRSLGSHLFVDVDQQIRDMLLALRAGHQVGKGQTGEALMTALMAHGSCGLVVVTKKCQFWTGFVLKARKMDWFQVPRDWLDSTGNLKSED